MADDDEILNQALAFAQEWGENFQKPIQERLGKVHPDLSARELDRFNDVAQKAMAYGYDTVQERVERYGSAFPKPDWEDDVRAIYPWVDDDNLSHLYSTGLRNASHDGLDLY